MADHGTRACYYTGCRRPECQAARRTAEQQRSRLKAYGQWEPYIDAEPVREHLRVLSAAGIGLKRSCELSGVPYSTLMRLIYGGKNQPPSRRVRPATASAILAVRPSPGLLADGAFTDGTGTRRRITALVAIGWSQQKLADALGMEHRNLGHLLADREQVTARTARTVRDLYDRLWNTPPPAGTRWEKTSATRSRGYAARRGWQPPGVWDDADMDDPAARPSVEWLRPGGNRYRGSQLADDVRELMRYELGRTAIAERLGVTVDAIDKALSRHPEGENTSVA
jgi:transcriptional regulator with XRE-family HTH domain